mmetsp:Transcript_52598/g.157608  ORF Transcript_52598/g.157608 Transcript_52598/m.157608 type:complete len:234 (-) Transcript_52598:512-1213(-)
MFDFNPSATMFASVPFSSFSFPATLRERFANRSLTLDSDDDDDLRCFAFNWYTLLNLGLSSSGTAAERSLPSRASRPALCRRATLARAAMATMDLMDPRPPPKVRLRRSPPILLLVPVRGEEERALSRLEEAELSARELPSSSRSLSSFSSLAAPCLFSDGGGKRSCCVSGTTSSPSSFLSMSVPASLLSPQTLAAAAATYSSSMGSVSGTITFPASTTSSLPFCSRRSSFRS